MERQRERQGDRQIGAHRGRYKQTSRQTKTAIDKQAKHRCTDKHTQRNGKSGRPKDTTTHRHTETNTRRQDKQTQT